MSSVLGLFKKQYHDLTKNISVTMMYFLFPVLAFLMGSLIEGQMVGFVGQFASMFIGSAPLIIVCNTVAEDNEHKSLRFLRMAGVKPWQYVGGLAGFTIAVSIISVVAFALMAGFNGQTLINFLAMSILGLIASSILGATLGLFADNVQKAAALYTPFMMIFSLLPVFSQFNENFQRVASFTFPYQLMTYIFGMNDDLTRSYIVIIVNIVLIFIAFILAYKYKGMKG